MRAGERGQATVEAAFLIPVLFTVLLLSVQPGMVLYDRMVMRAAASDACRLAAAKTDAVGDSSQAVEAAIGWAPSRPSPAFTCTTEVAAGRCPCEGTSVPRG